MSSKQISIKKKIYDKILKMKKPGESFSDFLEFLLERDSNFYQLKDCFGLSKDLPEIKDVLLESINKVRSSFKTRNFC
jgi:predicted CopG family antitoxin